MQGDAITQDGHDVVTVCSKTENKSGGTIYEHPDLDIAFLSSRNTVLPSVVDDGERSDSVTQIVGTAVG